MGKDLETYIEEKKRGKTEPETSFGWVPYAPFQREAPRPRRFANAASIWVHAKKMIAVEMRRAKGVKKPDTRGLAMERFAAEWERKKEEERVRKQREEEERTRRQRKEEMLEAMIGESLEAFAVENQRLKAEREEQRAAGRLFRQALEAVGEVSELSRRDGGWRVLMEPWEEKRERRVREGDMSSPIIYQMEVDNEFNITSCTSQGDPIIQKRILGQLNDELERRLRHPMDIQMEEARPRPISDIERETLHQRREKEREVARLCDQALEDFGRVLKITSCADGWQARIELWEEMGRRGSDPQQFDLKLDKELKIVSYEAA